MQFSLWSNKITSLTVKLFPLMRGIFQPLSTRGFSPRPLQMAKGQSTNKTLASMGFNVSSLTLKIRQLRWRGLKPQNE